MQIIFITIKETTSGFWWTLLTFRFAWYGMCCNKMIQLIRCMLLKDGRAHFLLSGHWADFPPVMNFWCHPVKTTCLLSGQDLINILMLYLISDLCPELFPCYHVPAAAELPVQLLLHVIYTGNVQFPCNRKRQIQLGSGYQLKVYISARLLHLQFQLLFVVLRTSQS
jgi:hypothetical protein